MGYDTLVDKTQLESALTATADAIRGKTGGTDKIEWASDTGFKTAVEAISTGGSGGGNVETCEVIINYPSNMQLDVEYTKLSAGTLILDVTPTLSESGEVTFDIVKNTMMSVGYAVGGGTNLTFMAGGEVYSYRTDNDFALFEVYGEGSITILDSGA